LITEHWVFQACVLAPSVKSEKKVRAILEALSDSTNRQVAYQWLWCITLFRIYSPWQIYSLPGLIYRGTQQMDLRSVFYFGFAMGSQSLANLNSFESLTCFTARWKRRE